MLFALPRTVPVLAAVPERLTAVVEQPVEAASSEAEEEALPKLPYADGVYVGSSRGYGGTVRVQVTMENGSITEVEILDASHETKQFLRRAKRLLTTVVDAQSWEVDAVSEATYTSRGILGAVQNALTGEVVNNPLPPQPKPAAPLVVEEFTAPSTYLDGIYTAEAMGFEGQITVQITVAEDKITDITVLSAEDEEEYLSRAKRVIPAILEGQNPNVDAVSGATYSSTGILNAVKLALAQPGTGERRFTFEADKNEKSEKENDTKNENPVKNNHFTGLSAVIPGQADPGTLPAQRWEAPQPPRPAAAPGKTPSFTANTPPVQPARAAAAVPSWRQSAPAEDILDPVVTLHSPEKPDATEVQPAPQPFRAAAGEAQLDVHPETDTAADPQLDHMAAWTTVPAAPEIEAATVPYQPEEPEQPEQPEQLGFDVPQGEEPLRYVGEVFRTYILAERGDELCLIDKHAAHERQLYEKLAVNYGNVPSQLLLQPAAIDLSAEEKQALLENQPLLENAGLDVADFGGSTVLLRAVPADVEPQNAEDLLVEIADRLLKGSRDALNEHTEWVLHSISCRAAIKAGDKSSPQELLALAEKILSGEVPPFCPHGRPCVLKLTRKELEKQFGRIV